MGFIETLVAFIHRRDIYKVTIFVITNIIIIFLIYYCRFVYPVAVGVGAGGAARGGAAQHDDGAGASPAAPAANRTSRAPHTGLLYLLQRRALLPPPPALSPLDHWDEE